MSHLTSIGILNENFKALFKVIDLLMCNVLPEGIGFQHQNMSELDMDSGGMVGSVNGTIGDGLSIAVLQMNSYLSAAVME